MTGTNVKTEFDTFYAFCLRRVLQAEPEFNQRTNRTVRAVDGAFFRLKSFPILGLRDMKPLWDCAEAVWFMSGDDDPAFMERFGFNSWGKFVDMDGRVQAATGFRWRTAFGMDQLAVVLAKLRTDRSSRQAVLQTWSPEDDLVDPGPNAPCLVSWHFHVIHGRLHVSVFQRSGDLYFGVPHDVLGCRLVQELMAASLDLVPGNVSYMVSNAHLYEDQWKAAEEMAAREEACTTQAMYPADLGLTSQHGSRALEGDKELVADLSARIEKFYRPFPPIRGPKLAR